MDFQKAQIRRPHLLCIHFCRGLRVSQLMCLFCDAVHRLLPAFRVLGDAVVVRYYVNTGLSQYLVLPYSIQDFEEDQSYTNHHYGGINSFDWSSNKPRSNGPPIPSTQSPSSSSFSLPLAAATPSSSYVVWPPLCHTNLIPALIWQSPDFSFRLLCCMSSTLSFHVAKS